MTNGEKIKEIFPSMKVGFITDSQIGIYFVKNQHNAVVFSLDWWNAEYKEPTLPQYCDRNICLKNEYNNIGCEDCEVTKSQVPTTKNNLGVEKIVDVLGSYTDLDIPYKHKIAEDILNNLSSVTPQEPRWIPVSERLPKEHQRVIMSTKYASHYGTYHDDGFYNEMGKRSLVGIFAWMPLPEPYKVEPQESEDK